MNKIKNLVGKRFNKLTIIQRAKSIGYQTTWLCRCDCGTEKIIRSQCLKNGNTKSCGCLRSSKNERMGMRGENSPRWKGDAVGKSALHARIRKMIPKPDKCLFCEQKERLELANKSQKYKTTLDDWMYLCPSCHRRYDMGWWKLENEWWKKCSKCDSKLKVEENNFYVDKNQHWESKCIKCLKKTYLEKKKKGSILNSIWHSEKLGYRVYQYQHC